MLHEILNNRLDKIDDSFNGVNEKLDKFITVGGKIEFINQKMDTLKNNFEDHTKNHWKFISVCLAILALAGISIAIAEKFLK